MKAYISLFLHGERNALEASWSLGSGHQGAGRTLSGTCGLTCSESPGAAICLSFTGLRSHGHCSYFLNW